MRDILVTYDKMKITNNPRSNGENLVACIYGSLGVPFLYKRIAKEIDFFVVEAPVMASFAKVFGPALGRLGKMPLPQHILPPGADPCALVEKLRRTVRIRARKSPVH